MVYIMLIAVLALGLHIHINLWKIHLHIRITDQPLSIDSDFTPAVGCHSASSCRDLAHCCSHLIPQCLCNVSKCGTKTKTVSVFVVKHTVCNIIHICSSRNSVCSLVCDIFPQIIIALFQPDCIAAPDIAVFIHKCNSEFHCFIIDIYSLIIHISASHNLIGQQLSL